MSKASSLRRPAAFSRIAYFALLSIFMMAATLHLGAPKALAAQATLSWTAPTTYTDGSSLTALGGYKVYSGTTSGNLTQSIDVGKVTSYAFSSLSDATTYYFAVEAYDSTGSTSALSTQASLTTPAAPPPNPLYTLTASAGSGGSIAPSGAIVVSQGNSQSFALTPATGFKVAGVSVDGASVGAVSSYSFSNVAANHTIAATFSAASATSYAISATAGTGGSISPAGTTNVAAAGSQSFTLTPATGYKVAGVSVDGASVGAVSSYTFSNVAATHTIAATFSAASATSYAISATAGTGGSISPAGTTTVAAAGSQTFAVTAATGYMVAGVSVDGASVGAVSSYTFSNVAANHTIAATFSANAGGGTVGATIPQTGWTLKYADSQELTAQNGSATNAFDGSTGTMWHTQYSSSTPACPHEIQINLGKAYNLNGFSYLPRQDGGVNGTIAKYEFYVSSDGVNWGTAVATGTFANNTTLKQVSFASKTGQYIRLRALSEVNGGAWTSAAEINVNGTAATTTPVAANIPHTSWSLKYADSQELTAQNGAATNAFDGNTGTMWHTQYSSSTPACPHEIQINLGKSYSVSSFSYLPRQDGGINGTIAKYEFYVSSDGVNWGTAVATGTFANDTTLKQVTFAAKSGQYIRLRALSEVNGGAWTSAAEINVTGY